MYLVDVISQQKIKQQTNNRIDCIDSIDGISEHASTASGRNGRAFATEPSFTRKYTCSLVFVCFFSIRIVCIVVSFDARAHIHHHRRHHQSTNANKMCLLPAGLLAIAHAMDARRDDVYWENVCAWKNYSELKTIRIDGVDANHFVRMYFFSSPFLVI